MEPLNFNSSAYTIAGKPAYMNSGEFHYFRVPKADWRRRMRLFKEAGGNCLATYVPWLIHEPLEGQFRFKGEYWLDLEEFLITAREEGLYVTARPGPYQYSELIYDGLPGWLCENYPQLRATNIHGEPFRVSSVSYVHPLFLEKVSLWYNAVLPILARHTLAKGGPIAFIQIDNEMTGIHEWFGSLDYNPESMGFGNPDGRYPNYLRQKYLSITDLNQLYGTHYDSFDEVRPTDPAENSDEAIRNKKDYFNFYLSTIAEYARILVNQIRAHGIDVPIVHNSANPEMNPYFLETEAELGDQFLLGSDHYYNLDQNWAQNNPTPQYAIKVFASMEMLRLMGYPPTIFELPGGSCADWPPITASDAKTSYLTNLAMGMRGHNYYIFTGGPNPPHTGSSADIYDFSASIGPSGDIRPLYQSQKEFGHFILEHPSLIESTRAYDIRFALDYDYPRASHGWSQRGNHLFSDMEAWNFFRRGPLTTSFCASLSPELIDLRSENWISDSSTPLIVVSSESMAEAKQERIVRFIRSGGKALILPVIPSLDENLVPCSILADFLGSTPMSVIPNCQSRPNVLGKYIGFSSPFFFDYLPEGAERIGFDELSRKPLAWKRTFTGGGAAIALGVFWNQSKRDHEEMLRGLLGQLGLHQKVYCSNPNVWTTLWVKGDSAILFVLNLLTAPMTTDITIQLTPESQLTKLTALEVPSMTVLPIEVKL